MPLGLIGDIVGGIFGDRDSKRQTRYQYDFAQNGVQWRAEDARKAGIHPLAALGFNGPAYQPVNSPLGNAISNAGRRLADLKTNRLQQRQIETAIRVDEAQAKLLEAQAHTLGTQLERSYQNANYGAPGNPKPGKDNIGGDIRFRLTEQEEGKYSPEENIYRLIVEGNFPRAAEILMTRNIPQMVDWMARAASMGTVSRPRMENMVRNMQELAKDSDSETAKRRAEAARAAFRRIFGRDPR